MPLSVARPWKHPKTGVYWLRKGVPEELRPLVGKREEKRSLKTRDPAEAKRLHLEALSELEAKWANLRSGPRPLTERQLTQKEAHALASVCYDRIVTHFSTTPANRRSGAPTSVTRCLPLQKSRPARPSWIGRFPTQTGRKRVSCGSGAGLKPRLCSRSMD